MACTWAIALIATSPSPARSTRPVRRDRGVRQSSPACAVRDRRRARRRLDEAPRRRAQRELGIDVQPPRDVDDREEEVAELRERRRASGSVSGAGHAGPSDRLLELAELLAHLCPAARRDRASRSSTVAALRCTLRAWSSAGSDVGNVVEDPLATLLLGLDLLPALAHPTRRFAPRRRRTRADAAGRASACTSRATASRSALARAPRAAARGSRPGRAGRRARRGAHPGVTGQRGIGDLVRLLRPCAERSCAPSARDPRGTLGVGAGSAPGGR